MVPPTIPLLAIDPGNTHSAWVRRIGGQIASYGYGPNDDVLAVVRAGPPLGVLAIEMIASYGMAVGREVFDTCRWIGRFEQVGLTAGCIVRLVYRAEVKMHLCHSMRAKDANIRQALIDKLGPPGKKKSPGPTYGISGDVWAALAVAVTAAETPEPTR